MRLKSELVSASPNDGWGRAKHRAGNPVEIHPTGPSIQDINLAMHKGLAFRLRWHQHFKRL